MTPNILVVVRKKKMSMKLKYGNVNLKGHSSREQMQRSLETYYMVGYESLETL